MEFLLSAIVSVLKDTEVSVEGYVLPYLGLNPSDPSTCIETLPEPDSTGPQIQAALPLTKEDRPQLCSEQRD